MSQNQQMCTLQSILSVEGFAFFLIQSITYLLSLISACDEALSSKERTISKIFVNYFLLLLIA